MLTEKILKNVCIELDNIFRPYPYIFKCTGKKLYGNICYVDTSYWLSVILNEKTSYTVNYITWKNQEHQLYVKTDIINKLKEIDWQESMNDYLNGIARLGGFKAVMEVLNNV